jgi:hypothetical protein
MLIAAFIVLAAAALLGSALATLHLRTQNVAVVPWPLGLLHGLLGVGGLTCLGLALRGPPRGVDQGTASFGVMSAALIALAVCGRRRHRRQAGARWASRGSADRRPRDARGERLRRSRGVCFCRADCGCRPRRQAPVCVPKNLNPNIMVMKPAKDSA